MCKYQGSYCNAFEISVDLLKLNMNFFSWYLSGDLMLSYIDLSSSYKIKNHVLLRLQKSKPTSLKAFMRCFSVKESKTTRKTSRLYIQSPDRIDESFIVPKGLICALKGVTSVKFIIWISTTQFSIWVLTASLYSKSH